MSLDSETKPHIGVPTQPQGDQTNTENRGNQDTSRSPDHRTTMLSDCWFELKMMILCLLLEEFRDWKNKLLV